MAPRGLKSVLKKSAPAKLVTSGKFKAFQLLHQGTKVGGAKLKGLTKRLSSKLWSKGVLPTIAKRADARPGGHWGGKRGGIKRGTRVDAQLTRLINAGPAELKKAHHVYSLTKMAISGLASRGLEPVFAQRCVASQKHRIGTAADIVCYETKTNRLVLVEVKCGHDHGLAAPAVSRKGKACTMAAPLEAVPDCVVNRHSLQLALTRELFVQEKSTLAQMGDVGLDQDVGGLLMYVRDRGVEFFELSDWWKARAPGVLNALV